MGKFNIKATEMSEVVSRIKQMEQYLDEILSVINCCSDTLKTDVRLQEIICSLREYYENGQWLRDYECDERGELPVDLKRGVLAQDTLFNLFSMTDHVESVVSLTRGFDVDMRC